MITVEMLPVEMCTIANVEIAEMGAAEKVKCNGGAFWIDLGKKDQ